MVMKRILVTLLSVVLSGLLFTSNAAEKSKEVRKSKRGQVVHMVCFKFKEDAGSDKIREVETAFAALKSKIPEIVSYQSGTNVSPEKLDKGFTHGFVLTFKNQKDRDAYLVHPDHQEFGKLVKPVLADVFVLDFVNKK